MHLMSSVSRVVGDALAWFVLVSGASASIIAPWSPLPAVAEGHRSSLRARVTMIDGTSRAFTIQGVGCSENICSRVRATASMADGIWLDELAFVQTISHDPDGSVKATFTFRNGIERKVSIVQTNRVLYVDGQFKRTEKLDLRSLTRIDFE
jgi:hypothetical protein